MTRRWLAGEQGFAPVEFVLFTGLILLPTLILVASLPGWWERQSLARLAAQEAARSVVVASDWDAGVAHAAALVEQLARNHGVDPADLAVTLDGRLERGGAVTATATVRIPAMAVPFITATPGFTWRSSHTEAVDAYRSLDP